MGQELIGIQKSKQETYEQAVKEGKADGYLWFVRDIEDGILNKSAIYFGDRLYAVANDDIQGNDIEVYDYEEEIPSTEEEQTETINSVNDAVKNGGSIDLETNINAQTTID